MTNFNLLARGATPGFDVEALSGVLGSISIACWVCVFSPQIIENFRRSSAEGLSIVFLVIWLLGDLFNILGAVLQGVLPTMIILAVYYTLADIILICQVFYYRGFTLSDSPPQLPKEESPEQVIMDGNEHEQDEETPLLASGDSPIRVSAPQLPLPTLSLDQRRGSGASSVMDQLNAQGQHLNPAVPLVARATDGTPVPAAQNLKTSSLWSALFNIAALAVVCLAGALGWWISTHASQAPYERHDVGDYDPHDHSSEPSSGLAFDVWGQVFGYLCAVLYLASRVPQILLNYRRKSTEGVSILFFLFACVGNLTYVLSIFAFEPPCAGWNTALNERTGQPIGYGLGCQPGQWGAQYGRYIAVNLSWLIGSAGTLFLDLAVFVQFWMYRGKAPEEGAIRIDTPPPEEQR